MHIRGAANADYRAIASDSGIAIADDMKYYVVYTEKGKTDYVYAVFSISEIAATSYTMNGGVYYCLKPPTGIVITVVRYSYQNIYSNPTSLNEKFSFQLVIICTALILIPGCVMRQLEIVLPLKIL